MLLFAQAVPVELIKLLPDATAAVAVIAVVMLFLKQQDKQAENVKEMTDSFQEAVRDLTKEHRELVTEIGRRETDSRVAFQAQIQALLEANLGSRKDLIDGFRDLKTTIESTVRRTNDTSTKQTP